MRYFIIFFALLAFLTSCDRRTTIVNGLNEREANEIVVLLASRDIPAEKIPAPTGGAAGAGGRANLWDISVPAAQITDALAVLNQAGLPRVQGSSLLDLFGTQRIVPSDLQDRVRYQEGLAAQLANTIRMMDGVIDANVQITLIGQNETTPETPTASIYIRHRGVLDNPNSTLVNKIRRLVSSALPGLTPENVTVVTDRAGFGEIREEDRMRAEREGIVQIWGVELLAHSAPLFRFIFYAFIVLLFLALSLILWLGWKFYPTIESEGFRSLFTLRQFPPSPKEPPASTEEELFT